MNWSLPSLHRRSLKAVCLSLVKKLIVLIILGSSFCKGNEFLEFLEVGGGGQGGG